MNVRKENRRQHGEFELGRWLSWLIADIREWWQVEGRAQWRRATGLNPDGSTGPLFFIGDDGRKWIYVTKGPSSLPEWQHVSVIPSGHILRGGNIPPVYDGKVWR